MPRYTHPDTEHSVETSNPTEGTQLRAAGYREQKALTQSVKAADAEREQARRQRREQNEVGTELGTVTGS